MSVNRALRFLGLAFLKIKGLCDNIDSYSNSQPPFWAKMPTGTT
jgi:hypothetical protein